MCHRAAQYIGASPGAATAQRTDESFADWIDETLSKEARRLLKQVSVAAPHTEGRGREGGRVGDEPR